MSMLPMSSDVFGGGQFDPQTTGLGLLGQTRLSAAGPSTAILNIEPRHYLMVIGIITSMSTTGQPFIRLGADAGAVDATVAYWTRNMRSTNNSAIVSGNFGNDPRANANQLRLGYSRTDAVQTDISDLGGTEHRMIFMNIWNLPGTRAVCQWVSAKGTGAAATVGNIWTGWGEWSNTSGVRSIQLFSHDAVATLGIGSGLSVWGSTLP